MMGSTARYDFRCTGIMLFFMIMAFSAGPALSSEAHVFSSEKADFSIRFKNEAGAYKIMSVFLLPREEMRIGVRRPGADGQYAGVSSGGRLQKSGAREWLFRAPPEKGLYRIKIENRNSRSAITLNIFVMVPYGLLKGEFLNGYRIGKYPKIAFRGLNIYRPPKGFVEVTEENAHVFVSPHFQLKQFICKQSAGYPKYLVLKETLLLKLEHILGRVNSQGCACETFHIMSGYRTPFYNHVIGNVKYSRHLWGGAADFFVDVSPKDGIMDDLNKDGKIDWKDGAILYRMIDKMRWKNEFRPFLGGLARYKKTPSHGPFVHIDVRGKSTRWGL